MIVFGAKRKVDNDNVDFNDGDDENRGNESEESKEVVVLVRPRRFEQEEELDKGDSKRHETRDEDRGHRLEIPDLVRDLPRDLVRPDGVLDDRFLLAKVGSCVDERERNAEPHRDCRSERQLVSRRQ